MTQLPSHNGTMGNEERQLKQRRTVLSGVVTPFSSPESQSPGPESSPARRAPRKIQQTVYLTPAVHDQLRELAFAERVKTHSILMEGLDLVFRARGLKPLSELSRGHDAIVRGSWRNGVISYTNASDSE